MCALPAPPAPPPGKRKEIYKYDAPWTVYSMNWSIRPDKRFRLALGSFVEEYNNKVSTIIPYYKLTLPEHLSPPSVLSGVRVAQSIVFCRPLLFFNEKMAS